MVTGRDLILYILSNGLEDEPIFKDGTFVGFMSEEEAAVKLGVGVASIRTGFDLGIFQGFKMGQKVFILKDLKRGNGNEKSE